MEYWEDSVKVWNSKQKVKEEIKLNENCRNLNIRFSLSLVQIWISGKFYIFCHTWAVHETFVGKCCLIAIMRAGLNNSKHSCNSLYRAFPHVLQSETQQVEIMRNFLPHRQTAPRILWRSDSKSTKVCLLERFQFNSWLSLKNWRVQVLELKAIVKRYKNCLKILAHFIPLLIHNLLR